MSLPVPVSMNPKPLSVFRLIVPWGILLTFLKKEFAASPEARDSIAAQPNCSSQDGLAAVRWVR